MSSNCSATLLTNRRLAVRISSGAARSKTRSSISSRKRMQRPLSFTWVNTSWSTSRESAYHLATTLVTRTWKKTASASRAKAMAKRVFPVPGGP